METFRNFLEQSRKRNGEKYLPKTIKLYIDDINRFINKINFNNGFDGMIDSMNKILKKHHYLHLRSAFRMFLIFYGMEEDDEKLSRLKSQHKIATALTSQRVLSNKVISKRDLKILYSNVDDEWKLIIGFLYDTACRESEMLNVRYKDIVFLNNPESKIKAEVRIMGKGGKTRIVFLMEGTVMLLKKLRPNIQPNDKIFVFYKKKGELYKRQEKALIDGLKKRTLDLIGKAHSPHDFRHTKLTHLAENNADILGISSFAGHNHLSTTNVYVKMSKKIAENTYENYSEGIL